MNLSPRTVEDQIQAMRKKFQARNKAELISKLLEK